MKRLLLIVLPLLLIVGCEKEPINYETTLVERDGVFYTKDTNKPYSGQVFSLYDDGEKKREGNLKDGKLDGLWTYWYENGQKKWEGTFKDGKSIFVKHSEESIKNMVFVQGGTYQMGSNSGDDDEQPIHTVTVSSFYMDKTEVTQAEYRKVMGKNPSHFSGCDDCPVESVSWHDANAYAKKVGKRLPTEAEWEYAARGGNKSKGYTYSGSNDLDAVGWYRSNSGSKSHPVAQKQPNELGLYDMSGNVWEWCWDWYGDYSSSSQTDPQGSNSGEYRVLRGGPWSSRGVSRCRVADRYGHYPRLRSINYGFRLVLSQDL